MKLTDLDPRWYVLQQGGPRVGLTFDCPHCVGSGQRLGVSFHHRGREAMEDAIIHARKPGEHIWTIEGDDFAALSLSPSVDASHVGHWHGLITNGEIVGGL